MIEDETAVRLLAMRTLLRRGYATLWAGPAKRPEGQEQTR